MIKRGGLSFHVMSVLYTHETSNNLNVLKRILRGRKMLDEIKNLRESYLEFSC
jgi:hypothetical protein